MWIQHSDFRFNFITWDELAHLSIHQQGAPWKILRKDVTTLAQTWSVLSYSNLAPTTHTSNSNMDIARLISGIGMKMDMDMDLGKMISS